MEHKMETEEKGQRLAQISQISGVIYFLLFLIGAVTLFVLVCMEELGFIDLIVFGYCWLHVCRYLDMLTVSAIAEVKGLRRKGLFKEDLCEVGRNVGLFLLAAVGIIVFCACLGGILGQPIYGFFIVGAIVVGVALHC